MNQTEFPLFFRVLKWIRQLSSMSNRRQGCEREFGPKTRQAKFTDDNSMEGRIQACAPESNPRSPQALDWHSWRSSPCTCEWGQDFRLHSWEENMASSMMEGPLSKWTNVMQGWQYRWFVLDDNAGLLSYYTVSSPFSYKTVSYHLGLGRSGTLKNVA